jgi:Spy/CpxP family protein refolding chaperone
MRTISILAATLALLAMTLIPALAQQQHQHGATPGQPPAGGEVQPSPGVPQGGPHSQMMSRLTQQQQEALQNLQQTKFREVYPLVLQLRASRAQLVAELGQDKVNRNAVDQAIKEMNAIRTRIDQHRVDLVMRLKELGLPPEVFGSMLMHHGLKGLFGRDMDGAMRGGMRGGMGGGMGGGMCPRMGQGGMGHGMMSGMGAGAEEGGVRPMEGLEEDDEL